MNRLISFLIPLLIGTSVSCAKKLSVPPFTEVQALPHDTLVNAKSNQKELDSIHAQFWHWYYGKYNVSYSDNSRKIGFKLSLRCTQDSVASALITFAAIPVVNSLISKDSLTYVNKKDRCFEIYPVEKTKKILGIALTLENLQELFLGLPIGFNSSLQFVKKTMRDSTIFSYQDEKLSTRYTLLSSSNILLNQSLELADGRKMHVEYKEWEKGLMNVPSSLNLTITDKDQVMHIKMNTERFEIRVPQEIELIIPDDYEKCN